MSSITHLNQFSEYSAFKMIQSISADEAKELIANNPSLLIIDVRTAPEVERGRIKDSLNIPLDKLEGELKTIKPDRRILIYCLSGSRSAVAAEILENRGYKKIYNLRHGLLEWRLKHLPVVEE